jgi:hypothetical protein
MRSKIMAFAELWLPILGAGICIAWAIGAWYGGSKNLSIWLTFGGAVCLLLLGTLQWQHSIEAIKKDGGRSADFEERRANIQLLRFYTVALQDNALEPLKGWAIQAIFKNVGQTAAKQVRIAYGHQYFAGAVPPDVNMTADFSPDAPTVDVGQGVVFRSEIKKFAMDIFDGVNTKGGNLLLLGEVRYADIYPGTEPHVSEFCASIVIRRDPHFFPGAGVIYDGPLDFQACRNHNSSR